MPFYTLLWHIRCQSDFDELVSVVSRPVYRGSCRMEETKVPFHPVKRPFGQTKLLIAEVQSQASRHIELGAAIEL